ncbi:tyrosine-type recombinase/integrase [Caproiciproducens sp. R2]|uniref:tyrosine-type recombinase/integrase n=1 Tax=Caproiciproducens sp. R2 TaxID=3435187 RepID=UPI004033C74F
MAKRKKKTTHSSGMYRKRITIGHDENGKPIIKAVYANSIEEMENKIAQLRIDRNMGVVVTNDKSTWEYWANAWSKLSYPKMGKTTKDMYRAAISHLSSLNGRKISQLSPIDLQEVTSKMYIDGYSKRTIKSVISAARQVSKLAKKNHACAQLISEDVSPEKSAPVKDITSITPAEEELIWNVKPLSEDNKMDKARAKRLPLIRMFALMQLSCGLRREEAAALEWRGNIDFESQNVIIDHAYSFAENDTKEPKSKSGFRKIPIPKRYLDELKKWKEINGNTFLGSKYVFPGNNGIMTSGQFRRLWDILIDAINGVTVSQRISAKRKKKGIKREIILAHDFNSHQLRHTYSTNCIAAGIDIRTVQYLMGHATAKMTLDYADLSPSALEETRKILNRSSLESSNETTA